MAWPVTAAARSPEGPVKVDRSAAYATRWVARIVAAGLARRCEVQVAIRSARPSQWVSTSRRSARNGPGGQDQHAITTVFDLRPAAIIDDLDLLRPIYAATAAYGHFGRTSAAGLTNGFTWERTDRIEELRRAVAG